MASVPHWSERRRGREMRSNRAKPILERGERRTGFLVDVSVRKAPRRRAARNPMEAKKRPISTRL